MPIGGTPPPLPPPTWNRMQHMVYNWHKQVATSLGFGQSLFKHRSLTGVISTSPTGVRVLTPGGARMDDEPTVDTAVWAMWEQKLPRTTPADDIIPGKTLYENFTGQMPLFNDNGIAIAVFDEDWLQDNQTPANRYKVQNPKVDPALSFITFEMERLR